MSIVSDYLTRIARMHREAEQENAERDAAKRQPVIDEIKRGGTLRH